MKGFGNLWIHLNEELLLLRKVIIPIGDFSIHPFGKRLAYYSVSDVNQPLARDLMKVPVFRQVAWEERIELCSLKNASNAEVFILWTIQLLDIVAFYAKE